MTATNMCSTFGDFRCRQLATKIIEALATREELLDHQNCYLLYSYISHSHPINIKAITI